jgi:hypothetical protein
MKQNSGNEKTMAEIDPKRTVIRYDLKIYPDHYSTFTKSFDSFLHTGQIQWRALHSPRLFLGVTDDPKIKSETKKRGHTEITPSKLFLKLLALSNLNEHH